MPYTNPYTKHILVKYTKPICKIHDSNFLYNLFAAKIESFFDLTKFFTEQKRTFKSLFDLTKSVKIRCVSLISRNFWKKKKLKLQSILCFDEIFVEQKMLKFQSILRFDVFFAEQKTNAIAFFNFTTFLQYKKRTLKILISLWFHEIFAVKKRTLKILISLWFHKIFAEH